MSPNTFSKASDHIYWMPPGPPDRPSLCAVVGKAYTLMLDAGASAAHTHLFLDALQAANVPAPHYIALTHWHWDHVFGAAEVGAPVIAHKLTAQQLAVLSHYDWRDTALDQRVGAGEEIAFCADNIKLELPEPRAIQIVMPDIVIQDSLELQLGDVSCVISHVGGDHAGDSCVMYVKPDRVLFLGDCLYDAIYAPKRHYTTRRLFPLLDTILSYDAERYIEGHTDSLLTRADIEAMATRMRLAGTLVEQFGTDKDAVLAIAEKQSGQKPDDEMISLVDAFITGLSLEP